MKVQADIIEVQEENFGIVGRCTVSSVSGCMLVDGFFRHLHVFFPHLYKHNKLIVIPLLKNKLNKPYTSKLLVFWILECDIALNTHLDEEEEY